MVPSIRVWMGRLVNISHTAKRWLAYKTTP